VELYHHYPRFIMAWWIITDWEDLIALLRITNDGLARHIGH